MFHASGCYQKAPNAPTNPTHGQEVNCWIQAVDPSQIDDPGRVCYMADSRDYRPMSNGWPSAAQYDGLIASDGNKVYRAPAARWTCQCSVYGWPRQQ